MRYIIGIFIFGLVIAFSAIYFFNSIVKTVVETYASKVTGVEVRLDDVDISLMSGKGLVSGFTIASPKGFKEPHIIHIGEVMVNVNMGSLFSNNVRINAIEVLNPEITYEVNGNTSNVNVLKKQIAANLQNNTKQDNTSPGAKETKATSSRQFLVRNLTIQEAKVKVSSTSIVPDAATSMTLPKLHFENIGSHNHQEVVNAIIQGIVSRLVRLDQHLLNATRGTLKGAAEQIDKNIGNAVKGLLKGVGQ